MQCQQSRPDRKADVLMTLHESGWLSNPEIAEEVHAHEGNIRKITRELAEEGRLESKPDVRYPRRKVFRIP